MLSPPRFDCCLVWLVALECPCALPERIGAMLLAIVSFVVVALAGCTGRNDHASAEDTSATDGTRSSSIDAGCLPEVSRLFPLMGQAVGAIATVEGLVVVGARREGDPFCCSSGTGWVLETDRNCDESANPLLEFGWSPIGAVAITNDLYVAGTAFLGLETPEVRIARLASDRRSLVPLVSPIFQGRALRMCATTASAVVVGWTEADGAPSGPFAFDILTGFQFLGAPGGGARYRNVACSGNRMVALGSDLQGNGPQTTNAFVADLVLGDGSITQGAIKLLEPGFHPLCIGTSESLTVVGGLEPGGGVVMIAATSAPIAYLRPKEFSSVTACSVDTAGKITILGMAGERLILATGSAGKDFGGATDASTPSPIPPGSSKYVDRLVFVPGAMLLLGLVENPQDPLGPTGALMTAIPVP